MAARDDLNQLLDTLDVEELFDTLGVEWRRTSGGNDLQVKTCPACGDSRWRTYFSTAKRRGLCFHADCQKRFNLFTFVRAQLGAEVPATIRYLTDYGARVGLHVRKPVRAVPQPANGDWTLPPSVDLPTPEGMTHPYLLNRGILLRTQELFGLRWCEQGSFAFEDAYGRARNMDFSQRVILPIRDLDGALVTFVGRDVTGTAEIRYLFPPTLASAGTFFYGGDLARGKRHLILGEGPFDAIAIHQAIADHPDWRDAAAIGSFGLSIGHADQDGNDQLGRLRRLHAEGMTRLTFLWDGEANALKAALNAAGKVAGSISGLDVRIGLLPKDSDPAEVESRIAREAIEAAQAFSPSLRARLLLRNPYQ